MNKNNLVIIIVSIIVFLSLCLDIVPNMSVDIKIKLMIYIFSVFIVWTSMKIQSRKMIDEMEKEKNRKKNLTVIFIIYSILVATLLFLDSNYGRTNMYGDIQLFSKEHFDYYSNFMPFKTIFELIGRLQQGRISISIILTNILGNMIVFAPYGIFIPLIYKEKFSSFKKFTLLMILIVFGVELIQFITRTGIFDIDDLILNVLGAVIGFGLMKIKPITKLVNFVIK